MSAYFVDALRNENPETETLRYYANSRDGEGAVVSYAFLQQAPFDADRRLGLYGHPTDSFRSLDVTTRDMVRDAMAQVSAVANVKFVEEVESVTASVVIGSFDMIESIGGLAYYPIYQKDGGLQPNGEIWIDTSRGDWTFGVILHELGHSLGLEHPFEGRLILPRAEDLKVNTVMSYEWDILPTQLGLFDVIALQSIYGPAQERLGDDTYVFGRNKLIWDGGGHDRIDARGMTQGVTLLLDDGSWSHAGGLSSSLLDPFQVWLGHFTQIEDARGSRFGDTIRGNEAANRLAGGKGHDSLSGGAGPDRLGGASGHDDLRGGPGDDRLYGGTGADVLGGGAGQDRLVGGNGADRLWGGEGGDTFVFSNKWAAGAGTSRDIVGSFDTLDRIDLSALDLQFLGQHAFTGAGHELRTTVLDGGTLLLADFDGDGRGEFQIWLRGAAGVASDQLLL